MGISIKRCSRRICISVTYVDFNQVKGGGNMEEQTVDQEYDIVPSNGGISIDQVIESNWTGVAIWLQMNKVLDGDKYGIIEHAVAVYLSSAASESGRTPPDIQKVFNLSYNQWRRIKGHLLGLSFVV